MYIDLTKEEIINRKNYWYSKSCNCIFREHRDLFYSLYTVYDNLLKSLESKNISCKS